MLERVYDIDPTTQIEHTPEHMLMVRAYMGFLPILRMFPKIVYAPLPEDLFDFYTEKQIWALLKVCYDAMDDVFKDKIVITDEHARYASDVLAAVAMSGQYEFEKFVLGYNGIQKQSGGGKEYELHTIFEKQFIQNQRGGMPGESNNNNSNSNNNNSSHKLAAGAKELSTFVQGGIGTASVASGIAGAAGILDMATMASELGRVAERATPEGKQQLILRAQEVQNKLAVRLAEALITRDEQRGEQLVQYAKQEADEEGILLTVLGDPTMRIGERVIELIGNMDKEEDQNKIRKIIASTMKTLHAKFVMNRGAIQVSIDGKEQLISINDVVETAQRLDVFPKGSGYAQYILALTLGPTVGDEEGTFTLTDKATSPLIMLIAASGSGYAAYKILAPIFTKTRPLSNPTPSYTGMIPVLHHDEDGNRLENVEIENKAGHLAVLKKDRGGIIQFKANEVELYPLSGDKRVARKFAPGTPGLVMKSDGFFGQSQVQAERGPADLVQSIGAFRKQRLDEIGEERKQLKCGELEEIQRKLGEKRAIFNGADGKTLLESLEADIARLKLEKAAAEKHEIGFKDERLLRLKKAEETLIRLKDNTDSCKVGVIPEKIKIPGLKWELPAIFQKAAPKQGECPSQADKESIQEQLNETMAEVVEREKELGINNLTLLDVKGIAAAKAAELKAKEAELARKEAAHNKLDKEIKALEAREKVLPNGAQEQCRLLDEDQEVVDEAAPWWRVRDPVKNGKHGLVLVDVSDLEFITACPPGFRHDKLQCVPISAPTDLGADGKPLYSPNRWVCHTEQGKEKPVCIPMWQFEQKQSALTIPLGITYITLAAETTVMIDCAGRTLYFIAGTSGLVGLGAGVATHALTSYLPNVGPIKYAKGILPPLVGVGAGLVWGYSSLAAYECSLPIGFAISSIGYSTAAVVGGIALSAAAITALIYALRNFYRVHRRKRILAKSEKLVEKTEGIVWNKIRQEYLSNIIAEAKKTKNKRSSEEIYNTFLAFSTQIRSEVKKEIFNSHKKWEAAVKAWTDSKVPSIRGKKPEFSTYISGTLKDKIIDDLVKGFILDTLERETKRLTKSIEKQKRIRNEALELTKQTNIEEVRAKNPKLARQLEAAKKEAEDDLKLLDKTEIDDALRIVIIEEIQQSQEIKNIIKEILGFKISETGKGINVTKNTNLISSEVARSILEMAKARGKGKKGEAAVQKFHRASAAAEVEAAAMSRGLGEPDRGIQISLPSNAAASYASAAAQPAAKPASPPRAAQQPAPKPASPPRAAQQPAPKLASPSPSPKAAAAPSARAPSPPSPKAAAAPSARAPSSAKSSHSNAPKPPANNSSKPGNAVGNKEDRPPSSPKAGGGYPRKTRKNKSKN